MSVMETNINSILVTLNESNCPFAGNGKDQWLSEILFKSSFERYSLIEWILEQMGINISEISQNENSVESKIQYLTEALSAIGVCRATDTDIIEGTASMKKQLTFWNFLCTLLSKRHCLDNLSCESVDSNNSDSEKNVSKYELSTEYISKVCEHVNLIHSFDKKLQLFPAHLCKEVKEFFQKSPDQEVQYFPECLSNDLKQFLLKKSGRALTSEEIRKNYFETFGVPELELNVGRLMGVREKNFELKELQDKIIPEEAALNEVENSIAESLKSLEELAVTFDKVHDNLKPFLSNVKPDEFIDIGPAFKAVDDKLDSLLKLKNSASSLKTLDSELEILKADVSSFQVSSGCLPDDKLEEYLEILSKSQRKE